MKTLLSTASWPNIVYFSCCYHGTEINIESKENYSKQSFRNRYEILSANGPLSLVVPVHRGNSKQLVGEIKISYAENWPLRHWRAIESAYNNSPYFEYFKSEIREFYERRYERLLEFNLAQLQFLLKALRLQRPLILTSDFEAKPVILDLRDSIHPKKRLNEAAFKPYYQTFAHKSGFVPNLSMLDLLLNTGLASTDFLCSEEVVSELFS